MSSLSRKVSRQLLWGYYFFFLKKGRLKVWRRIQLKTEQEEELSRLERTLGTFLNPLIYLFGRVGVGSGGRKGVDQFPFCPHTVNHPSSGSSCSAGLRQDAEGLVACWMAAVGAWLLTAGGSTEKKIIIVSRDVTRFAECLLSMHGALGSIPSTT